MSVIRPVNAPDFAHLHFQAGPFEEQGEQSQKVREKVSYSTRAKTSRRVHIPVRTPSGNRSTAESAANSHPLVLRRRRRVVSFESSSISDRSAGRVLGHPLKRLAYDTSSTEVQR